MARPGKRPRLRLRTKLLLLLLASGAAVLAAEFGVRALMPAGRLLSPTAIEVFHERAREEAEMIRADRELGHVPVLDGPVYDKFGLLRRWGPRGSVASKREGVFRLLMLGDSVTRRATVVGPLRAMWRGGEVEFLNAGVESWNPVQEVEFYFRHQKQLAADHVVLWLHNNDFGESTVACFHDGQFTLCNPGAFVPVDPDWYGRSILYQLWIHSKHVDRLRPEHFTFRAAEVEAALLRLRDEVTGRGARLTVAMLPIFAAEHDWQPHERRARDLALEVLGRLGIEHVDLQPACEEAAALGLPVRAQPTDVHHPNERTGELLAAAAAPKLLPPPAVTSSAEPRVVATAGEQRIMVDAGRDFAGRRVLILGSTSGVVPETDLPRGRVALADDDYLRATADHDAPLFQGTLDAEGRAAMTVPVPAGAKPGTIVWHLAVVADRRGIHYEAVGWPLPMLVRP